jgi:glucose dehydrogenase
MGVVSHAKWRYRPGGMREAKKRTPSCNEMDRVAEKLRTIKAGGRPILFPKLNRTKCALEEENTGCIENHCNKRFSKDHQTNAGVETGKGNSSSHKILATRVYLGGGNTFFLLKTTNTGVERNGDYNSR